MKKNIIITAVILVLALFASIYAMSGDGGQQPAKPDKNTEAVQAQSEQAQQTKNAVNVVKEEVSGEEEKSDVRVTVKDQFGIDTGMTKDELAKFKEDYLKKDRQMFPGTQGTWFYDAKIDLNKYDVFKKNGVDLKKSGASTYKYNALFSEIIVTGITIGSEKLDNANTYKLKVEKILKGEEILKEKFGKIPEFINYYDDTDVAGRYEPFCNIKGIYFLWDSKMVSEKRHWIQKRPESTLLITDDGSVVYESNYEKLKYAKKWLNNKEDSSKLQKSEYHRKKIENTYKSSKMDETWEEAVKNVLQIIKLNDDVNFYKKTFRNEVSE